MEWQGLCNESTALRFRDGPLNDESLMMRRHKRGISEGSLRRECVRREKKRTSEGEWQEKGSGEENGDRNKEDGGAGGAGGGGGRKEREKNE